MHIVWLLICFAVIIGMVVISQKYKFSYDTILTILVVVCIASEFLKTVVSFEVNPYKEKWGYYLDPSDLPLHLCSIDIFFFFGLKWFIKNEKVKNTLLGFMMPTMLIGAFLALCIPTQGTDFTNPQVYQFFLYHAFLIYFAIMIIIREWVKVDWKLCFNNIIILLCFAVFSLWVNSALSVYGANFLYLSRPPMKGLPLLNLDHGYHVYLITLITIGVVVMLLVHGVIILIKRGKRHEASNGN